MTKLVVTKNWLSSHRGLLLVHFMIISGFLLYAFFLAHPLFDRFTAIPGEASLQKIALPDETNNVECQLAWQVVGNQTIQPIGWAFIEGQSSENTKTYIVLRSQTNTYVFDTVVQHRPDVTAYFEESGLNLDLSGFISTIPTARIKDGDYVVGLYLRKGAIEALQFLDSAISKSGNGAQTIVRTSQERTMSLPAESQNITSAMDTLQEVSADGEQLVEISGWAFINGQSSENSKIFVVLKSDTDTYVFDTILQERPDVTAYFQTMNLNLDASGFIARIPKEKVENGNYALGIFIRKGDIEALQYTGITINR